MNLRPFALAACLFAAAPAFADPLKPCAGGELLRPTKKVTADNDQIGGLERVPDNATDCLFGIPLAADPGVTLWRCLVDHGEGHEQTDADWRGAFMVWKQGAPAFAVKDDAMAGRYEAYVVAKADLDGDGTQERVVALWNAQGMGLGVNAWTLHVFDAAWRHLAAVEEVIDWGPSALVQAPDGKGCDLMVTAFVEDDSPKRGRGLAFEGRFLRFTGAALGPAADRPPIRRRLLNSFMQERIVTIERSPDSVESDPAFWLRPGKAVHSPHGTAPR